MKRFLARYPLDPREKSKKRQRVLLALTAACLFCAAVCLGTVSLLFGSLYFVKARLLSYFQTPMLAFLNLLPVVLATFFLYFLTNRAWLAFLLTSVVVLLGSFANFFKVLLRADNLVFSDLELIGAAAGIAGEYELRLNPWFWGGILAALLGTIFLALVCRGRLPSWRWKLGLAAVTAVAAVGSYQLWYDSRPLYDSFQNYTLFNQFQPTEDYASRGFVYPFLHSMEAAQTPAPPGYSKDAARALLAQYPEADIPPGKTVNVVCTMLESFSDFSRYPLDFAADPYAPLRPIWAESYCGSLVTDTQGGGTINAERSFLTGYFYPHTDYRRATESFVQYFDRQGYVTAGSHPGFSWFYNRKSVNQNLGFSAFDFSENLYDALTELDYAPDAVFFPTVRQLYDRRDRAAPYFAFHISYQNHSPYDGKTLNWPVAYVNRGQLSEESYFAVNNYLGGIADTAAQTAAFVEGFRDDPAPVVLVFFGDHKPTLGPSNRAYDELGIGAGQDEAGRLLSSYETPYFFWANDAARAALGTPLRGTGPTISPGYLMTELFTQLGWPGTPYMQQLRALAAAVPVRHSTGRMLENGEWTENLSGNSQKLLENSLIMQYYLRKTTHN